MEELPQVWALIVASKHSLLREVDSIHVSEESAIIASDNLYDNISRGYELLIEPYYLEDHENG